MWGALIRKIHSEIVKINPNKILLKSSPRKKEEKRN
jgi:hypothetical protein